ncbi:uncharacterized protein LOC133793937 isoform X2 [Humulus lupulus]|uniref:uncharacterized protein LOC133793937 isoform X2 n=1 Tax=Humulus lupulus TaxID=3486 RepID=UPI002B4171BD|nr:uncharacterized protein LOC133793937 isoform X2 [Humulus lupulus]
MAFHLHNAGIHRRFDLHSHSQTLSVSSILSENKIQSTDDEDRSLHHYQAQDTVPFDSPLVDTVCGHLDFDTEVLDVDSGLGDLEEEIVLDSEDEEINGTRLVTVIKSSSDYEIEKKSKWSDQLCVKGSEVSVKEIGKEKGLHGLQPACDGEFVSLNDNGTQELGEWSQADALGFVDHFLSINNVDLSQGTDYRKTPMEKSFTGSSANGPQILARRINMRTQVKEKGKFEWIDSDPREGMCTADDKWRNSLGNECRKRNGIFSFRKETMDLTCLEPRSGANSLREGRELAHVSEANSEVENSDLELELREQQSEASDIEGDTIGIYDIGFNTQIAAEAIEALAHGHYFGYNSADGCQDTKNTVKGSLRGVMEENAQLKHPFSQKSGCLENIFGNIKRRKRSDRLFGRKGSNSSRKQSRLPELVKRKKLVAETRLCSMNSADSIENSGKSPAKPIKPSMAEEFIDKRNTTVSGNDMISSTKPENIPLINKQHEGQCVKISSAACRTMLLGSEDRLKRIDNRSSNPVEKMDDNGEHGMLVYKRKRSSLNADPLKVHSTKEKGSKLCYSSESAKISKFTSFLEVDTWNYPRRKRTSRNIQKHPNITYPPIAPFSSNYQKRIVSNAAMKRELGDSTSSILECGSAAGSTISLGLAYGQTGKPDDTDSPSLAVDEGKTRTSVASTNKTFELCRSECRTISSKIGKNAVSSNYMINEYHKTPQDKNVPKSSLLKELINLGVPDYVPEFASKELRRRKDMAHVRILFSQHLDDDIVKHQKKIAARLGISIASCSMDATHFIADEFARTRNMLEAIALGKPVVTHLWLESCGLASCFIDERNYILRDAKKENKFGFSMPLSLSRASQHPLLMGYKVFITPNIKPDKEMITNLVKTVHGEVHLSATKSESTTSQ